MDAVPHLQQARRALGEPVPVGPGQRGEPGEPGCGALVMDGGGRAIEPLALFEEAHRMLPDARAALTLVDTFVDARTAGATAGRPLLLPHVVALARRFGWQLVEGDDAASSSGVGRRQLRFTRTRCPARWPVALTEQQAPAMRALFEQVFQRPMSHAEWTWKYGAGRGHGVGLAVPGGSWVAFYGGLTRPVRLFGRPALGCQVCDVMVAAQGRRSLARRGALHDVAATFLEREIGHGLPHAIGFGFPNDRAYRLAERLGLYDAVDSVVELSWPVVPAHGGSGAERDWRVFDIVRGGESGESGGRILAPADRRAADRLWRAMAASMHDVALGVRDAAWLAWRYLQHPLARYRVTLVRSRWWRRPVGIVVTRDRDGGVVDVIDLVARPADFAGLVRLARRQAAERGATRLVLWITRSQQARFAAVDAAPAEVRDLHIQVPANRHTPALDTALLEDRWFLMAGDADFT